MKNNSVYANLYTNQEKLEDIYIEENEAIQEVAISE